VLKIRPPLVLSEEQAGLVIRALDESLTEAQSAGAR
jgi:4-aminobutyrate aminotransferase-like enzyme